MRVREKIMHFMLIYVVLMLSSCKDEGGDSWSEKDKKFVISPPEWLIGTWEKESGSKEDMILECASNSFIYGEKGSAFDFVEFATSANEFYKEYEKNGGHAGNVELYDKKESENEYYIYLNIGYMGLYGISSPSPVEGVQPLLITKISSDKIETLNEKTFKSYQFKRIMK